MQPHTLLPTLHPTKLASFQKPDVWILWNHKAHLYLYHGREPRRISKRVQVKNSKVFSLNQSCPCAILFSILNFQDEMTNPSLGAHLNSHIAKFSARSQAPNSGRPHVQVVRGRDALGHSQSGEYADDL
jgi:hypothetical protein